MRSPTVITDLLGEIVSLFVSQNEIEWARSLKTLIAMFENDPDEACRQIRSLYGGMGSFSDVVLHDPDGIPLREENDALDRFRDELYDLCQSGEIRDR